MTMTNITGSTRVDEPLFQMIMTSTMPRPQAARNITPKRSMRPITAAVSARSRIDGPNDEPSGRPRIAPA